MTNIFSRAEKIQKHLYGLKNLLSQLKKMRLSTDHPIIATLIFWHESFCTFFLHFCAMQANLPHILFLHESIFLCQIGN